MKAARLAGSALPIALLILLLGVLRAAIGVALGGDPFVGGAAPAAQSLAGAWLAVLIGIPVAHRLRSPDPAPADRPPSRQRRSGYGNRAFWILFPSILAVTRLIEARLTGRLELPEVAGTLLVTLLFTLVVIGFYRWRQRGGPGPR